MAPVLLLLGGALTGLWGIAHLFPTRGVVRGFGDLSDDNRRIITMEWIVEGVALIFIGVLVVAVTLTDATSRVSSVVYYTSAAALVALAGVSLGTGFTINFLPFRLCPAIFTLSAVLIASGAAI